MSATGLDVFDKTLQKTNSWLEEISEALGPDRKLAWKVLSALLVRGAYYDQFEPAKQPTDGDLDRFTEEVAEGLSDVRPANPRKAIRAVFSVLSRHVPRGQIA